MRGSRGGCGLRRLAGLTGSALLLCGLAVSVASPAAASATITLDPVVSSYTDSRRPDLSIVDTPDLRVGSWRDSEGKHHKSRSYLSYDVSGLAGRIVVSARVYLAEMSVNDCSHARNWQLWQTSDIGPTTSWANPPQEQALLATIDGPFCPGSYIEADLTAAVVDALAQGRPRLTVELRVPQEVEGDLHLGRAVRRDVTLFVRADQPPATPFDISIDGKPCGGTGSIWISGLNPIISARVTDPDTTGQLVSATFAVWPRSRPQDRLEWTSTPAHAPTTEVFRVPDGFLADAVSYVFTVRASDDQTSTPWSPECEFIVDTVRPGAAPVVTSTDYPDDGQSHIGTAIPGEFTFSPNGVGDVAGYRYGFWIPSDFIAAPELGGAATVSITPTSDGPTTLVVYSVDRAGNVSNTTSYSFLVRDSAPRIQDLDRDAWAGDPHRLIFRPSMEGVASYTYRVDDGPQQTLAAAADGAAEVSVTPAFTGSTVYVFSVTVGGVASRENWINVSSDSRPVVTSAQYPSLAAGAPLGTPGIFEFRPHMHGVVSYVYQFNRGFVDEQPAETVAAAADGSASVIFTPTRTSGNRLNVYSVTAAGVRSLERVYTFDPISIAPDVYSDEYRPGLFDGGVGVTGVFLFLGNTSGVDSFIYRFGSGPELTVPTIEGEAAAFVEWTPEQPGYVQLVVRSHSTDGTISDPRTYLIAVAG
jgi:hypothetical protein